ncbi:MAG: ATP-dependent helicase [Vulcanimicrobiota bacterium]
MSKILDDLNKNQKDAVVYNEGPLLILAGAGSGKTRVITRKVAYLIYEMGVRPHQILAVTFTNKAASEMKERIGELMGDVWVPWLGTFHSICARILRVELPRIGKRGDFSIMDTGDKKQLVKEAMKELMISDKQYSVGRLASSISAVKNQLQSPGEYEASAYGKYAKMVAEVYHLYQQKLEKNRGKDFDDLLLHAVKLLENYPEVKQRYQEQFHYILIDEYQDVNFAQYRLAKIMSEKHGKICVVGDDDQSIYGFRGADVSIILRFEKDFPGARIIKLEENYRSTNIILDAAHAVVVHNKGRKNKKLFSTRKQGERIGCRANADGREEARFVAEKIAELNQKERKYKDIVVLYRTNSQSRAIEEILKQEGIPYNIIGGLRFYERAEIKDAIAYLRFIENHDDYLSLRRIINVPSRGIGSVNCEKIIDKAIHDNEEILEVMNHAKDLPRVGQKLQKSLNEFARTIRNLQKEKGKMSLPDFIHKVLTDVGYFQMLKTDSDPKKFERLDNLDELINDAREFELTNTEVNLEAFLEKVALYSDIDDKVDYNENEGGQVTLMTAHMAKGLEFPVVFIVGLEENIFPHFRSIQENSPKAIEEERRLFYVAMTRAIDKVYLSYARERTLHGRTHYQSPSRFLREVPEELIDHYMPEVSKRSFSRKVPSILDKRGLKPKDNKEKFNEGDIVYHKIFGQGKVLLSDKGYVTVNFSGVGKKYLSQDFLSHYGEKKKV